MRRLRPTKQQISLSLFPFLAVLICTVGALIVLLVLVVQQAHSQADSRAGDRERQHQAAADAANKLRQDEQDHAWRTEVLTQQRGELSQQLADRRLALSHLEEHIRRLEDQMKMLQAQATQFLTKSAGNEQDQDSARFELARLQAALLTEQQRLDAARKSAAGKKPSFTIIPYDGPNGTRRRPIYIECRKSGITIQPEGLTLLPQDFSGPLGPGNPLDAALRTIREHWSRAEGGTSRGEPYPLLIVRPDGAVAYSMARAALTSWDDEFGYELVEQDLSLSYPPSDARLAAVLYNSVKIARQRQELLAAAMPSRFGRRKSEEFAADPPRSESSRPSGSRGGESVGGRGAGASGLASAGVGSGDFETGGMGFSGAASGGQRSGMDRGQDGSTGEASPFGQGGNLSNGNSPGGYKTGDGLAMNDAASGRSQDSPAAYATDPAQFGSGGGNPDRGSSAATGGTASSAGQATQRSPAGSRPGGTAADGGGGSRSANGTQTQAGSETAGGKVAGAAGNGGNNPANMGQSSSAGGSGGSGSGTGQPIAETRGADWALSDYNIVNSTGITRPIHIDCRADKLIILPERGSGGQRVTIPIEDSTHDSIDEFVGVIRKRIDSWGIAVAGGYWKPVLKITVDPTAEHRFTELQTLLQDSGIEVARRDPVLQR